VDTASSETISPLVLDTDCRSRARSAAKYAVGVNFVFCSLRVSSMEDRTMAVCAKSVRIRFSFQMDYTDMLLTLEVRLLHFGKLVVQ
jgi:hypothetical protein